MGRTSKDKRVSLLCGLARGGKRREAYHRSSTFSLFKKRIFTTGKPRRKAGGLARPSSCFKSMKILIFSKVHLPPSSHPILVLPCLTSPLLQMWSVRWTCVPLPAAGRRFSLASCSGPPSHGSPPPAVAHAPPHTH